jgi:hypothetical protein
MGDKWNVSECDQQLVTNYSKIKHKNFIMSNEQMGIFISVFSFIRTDD